jgi:hypothetical protein
MDQYVLFIDESMWSRERLPKTFQIAGFYTPCSSQNRNDLLSHFNPIGTELIKTAGESSNIPSHLWRHSTDVHQYREHRENYPAFVSSILQEMPDSWKPIRIVNRLGLDFGHPETNYTMACAQLYLETIDQIRGELGEGKPIKLHLIYSRVCHEDDTGEIQTIPSNEYSNRLLIEIRVAASRRGDRVLTSTLGELYEASARREDVLVICDWLNNASTKSFGNLRNAPALKEELKSRFSDHDLDPAGWSDGIHDLIRTERYGEALIRLHNGMHEELFTEILQELVDLNARDRDYQLSVIVNFCAQLVETNRDSTAPEVFDYFLQKLLPGLRNCSQEQKQQTLDHFEYALHLYALSSANHRGSPEQAEIHAIEIERLTPSLAGRWEHTGLLIDGQLRLAVHWTDLMRFEDAAQRMEQFCRFIEETSSLFHDSVPTVFPDQVYSSLLGKALGTRLQTEMFRGLEDPQYMELARELSDRALEQFDDPADVARQKQYRCQLETYAGNMSSARSWLARSLGITDDSHSEIANFIDSLTDHWAQGFALIHWCRIGSYSLIHDNAESEAFWMAFKDTKNFRNNRWFREDSLDYPAHGIRRFLAPLLAHYGESEAIRLVRSLQHLEMADHSDRNESPLHDLSWSAAQIETAIAFSNSGEVSHAKKLLSNEEQARRGALQRLNRYIQRHESSPALSALVTLATELTSGIEEIIPLLGADHNKIRQLAAISRRVPW